jgi:hypothetical protein
MKISFDADLNEIKVVKVEVEQIAAQLKEAKSSIIDICESVIKVANAFKSSKSSISPGEGNILEI